MSNLVGMARVGSTSNLGGISFRCVPTHILVRKCAHCGQAKCLVLASLHIFLSLGGNNFGVWHCHSIENGADHCHYRADILIWFVGTPGCASGTVFSAVARW